MAASAPGSVLTGLQQNSPTVQRNRPQRGWLWKNVFGKAAGVLTGLSSSRSSLRLYSRMAWMALPALAAWMCVGVTYSRSCNGRRVSAGRQADRAREGVGGVGRAKSAACAQSLPCAAGKEIVISLPALCQFCFILWI